MEAIKAIRVRKWFPELADYKENLLSSLFSG